MKFVGADGGTGGSLGSVCALWSAVVTSDVMGAGIRPDRPLRCESAVVDMINDDGMMSL
jgi:hypothetical protein